MKKKVSGKGNGWLSVCPNCGYKPKSAHVEKHFPSRILCPICDYNGPTVDVRAEDYNHKNFETQKIPLPGEGKMVLPEIILMLILSAIAVLILWKVLRPLF
ncbi:MAG: hypothetical protein NTV88_00100 [Candidatus Micrarchaeota archaeon]|nr:hypothetical protein [Candidatus Micrarchaeota archaeon]